MKTISVICFAVVLSACSLLPRAHDPVLFDKVVWLDMQVEAVDCKGGTGWAIIANSAENTARYAEWRGDPQAANIRGLKNHIDRMVKGGSEKFCELGKRTAKGRINAIRTAWSGR